MSDGGILAKLDEINELPTLAVIAGELNRLLDDENTSASKVGAAIEKDQALASKILKLVNSAFFGLSSRVSSITHAITILGFNTVRNAAVSISVIKSFSGKGQGEQFNLADFWSHSVSVAVIARHLAEKCGLQTQNDCFTAALLHDMGKVVLSQCLTEKFEMVSSRMKREGISFNEAEKGIIDIDHAGIGAYLAKKWKLPPGLVDAIRYHHVPTKSAQDWELLLVVHGADVLSHFIGDGFKEHEAAYSTEEGRKKLCDRMHPDATAALEKALKMLPQWAPRACKEIESARIFFQ